MTIILSNRNRFPKKIFAGRFLSKFAVKRILNTQLHLAYVALSCETLKSAKQAVNDKLQGSTCSYIFKVLWGCYPRESEGLCFYRRWFVSLSVCLAVCLFVTTITK